MGRGLMSSRSSLKTLYGLTLLLTSQFSPGQALEPRSYSNVPIGQTFVVLGYLRSEGDITPTATSPLQDAELTIDVGVCGYKSSGQCPRGSLRR